MTGNTLTTNPITGTNAYANGAYGTPQQGFWGNTVGIGGTTPFGFGTPAFQPQVVNPILQTTPPQVLPYILNALACQQVCQQVVAQNPQAVLGIHPQTIAQ